MTEAFFKQGVLYLQGVITVHTVPSLWSTLAERYPALQAVDGAKIQYCDSAVLVVLFELMRRTPACPRLVCLHLPNSVPVLMHSYGVTDFFYLQ